VTRNRHPSIIAAPSSAGQSVLGVQGCELVADGALSSIAERWRSRAPGVLVLVAVANQPDRAGAPDTGFHLELTPPRWPGDTGRARAVFRRRHTGNPTPTWLASVIPLASSSRLGRSLEAAPSDK
jgi:hypothetical protein